MWRLPVLTLLVVLAHAVLLGDVPQAFSLFASKGAEPDAAQPVVRFVTRALPLEPAVAPKPPRSKRSVQSQPQPGAVPSLPASPDAADVPMLPSRTTAEPPTLPVMAQATEPAAVASEAVAIAAAAPVADTPAAPPTTTQAQAQSLDTVQLPPAVRLLYDGHGEERGFIKYTGSGEMVWEPDGAQYKARLEISTWGVRVRTWTSKGTLNAAGLAPLRFGDKPRGAELATHFQRDKNIISFSANNPDVPLQTGAQDKLSALLQLSAMVAGAPDRYAPGTTIRFQAADAHRAEPWNFRVGTTEPLDLPGGALAGLKLSKAPTVEFDQSIEVWLAPDMHYLPVRLRITEANGDFVDLLWRKTQKPDGS